MKRAAAILGLALVVAHASGGAMARRHPTEEPTPAQRGRLVAEQHCASCHALDRGQDSPSPRAPGFATREMRHTAGLEGRLKTLTRRGHYSMPAISLTDAEVADLLAYIETFGGQE